MTTTTVDADVSDDQHDAFDFDDFYLKIDEAGYSRIMRRIAPDGDESTIQVSAFNSSI